MLVFENFSADTLLCVQIAENRPGTLLVTIDSKRLSLNIDCPGLILHQHDTSGKKEVAEHMFEDANVFRKMEDKGQEQLKTRA